MTSGVPFIDRLKRLECFCGQRHTLNPLQPAGSADTRRHAERPGVLKLVAEQITEANVAFMRNILIAEEHHLKAQPGIPDNRALFE